MWKDYQEKQQEKKCLSFSPQKLKAAPWPSKPQPCTGKESENDMKDKEKRLRVHTDTSNNSSIKKELDWHYEDRKLTLFISSP